MAQAKTQAGEPPKYISAGYPEKLFQLVGWEMVETGGRRAAKRNKTTVLMPVYEAGDGEKILVPLYSKKCNYPIDTQSII